MVATAPSWGTTIGVCAVVLSAVVGPVIQLLRDPLLRDADHTALREADRQTAPPSLSLLVSGGVPVAVASLVLFLHVARRDQRLEGHELAVLCAGTGAFLLLIAIDIIRSRRRRPSDGPSLTL